MRRIPRTIASIAVATALLATPAMASASTVAATSSDAWVTLSTLNPAGATALAGSDVVATPTAATMAGSAAAVQPVDADYHANPLPLPVIGVLLAVLGAAIYIALIEKHHSHRAFVISPA